VPETPRVSIGDPSELGRPADLLEGHEPDESRVADRWKVGGLVILVLILGGFLAGRFIIENRAEQQARDAAFAIVDKVHLRGEIKQIHGVQDGVDGVISAEVQVTSFGEGLGDDRVSGVRFEGEGLTPRPPDLAGLLELPRYVRPESDVACGRVSAGRFPEAVAVVLDVVPRSGVTHSQRLPVQPRVVREALLQACDLPDPNAQTRVEVQGAADGTLLLFLEPVQRSRQVLVLEAVSVPGFDVRPVQGLSLPRSLPPGVGGLYGFSVRVDDCATAREPHEVAVRLRVGGALGTRMASADVSQPQPGGVPVTQLLQRLVRRAC
jgi:hypothetical protein